MRFEIVHRTSYDYDEAVFIEPMTFRLRPRTDPTQRLETFSLTIDPEPAGRQEAEDAEGNVVTYAWFAGTTEHLRIESRSVVETLRTNPFDFIVIQPELLRVPLSYPEADPLQRFRSDGEEGRDLAEELIAASGGDAIDFLDRLTKSLHERIEYEVREEGDPRSAAETLRLGIGSCRDLTVVFIEAARAAGFAARFVSGYQAAEEVDGPRALHAWPEVFIAGAGWRAFDPSLALAVADRHIAIAAAPAPAGAAPTTGKYRGSSGARMSSHIAIETA